MNKRLRKQLLALLKTDQSIRRKGKWDEVIDRQNVAILKTLIGNFGWPTIDDVGTEGVEAAWLVAQHADFDVPFQRRCLALIKKLSKSHQVPLHHVAYLTDRILLNTGKKQVFGTQTYESNGAFMPEPIRNPGSVDSRRRKYNLPPLKDYLEGLRRFWSRQQGE